MRIQNPSSSASRWLPDLRYGKTRAFAPSLMGTGLVYGLSYLQLCSQSDIRSEHRQPRQSEAGSTCDLWVYRGLVRRAPPLCLAACPSVTASTAASRLRYRYFPSCMQLLQTSRLCSGMLLDLLLHGHAHASDQHLHLEQGELRCRIRS